MVLSIDLRGSLLLASYLTFAVNLPGQQLPGGIPVRDELVIAKCGSCHARAGDGTMDRISWERSTPEGWQDVLKRMIIVNKVAVSPAEARSIVR